MCGYLCGYSTPTVKRCALLSGLFALGVATATALLGLIVVLVGGIFGGIPPTVRYLLALVPIAMGLHLLGVITINVPGSRTGNQFGPALLAHSSQGYCSRW